MRRLYTWTSPDGQYWNQIACSFCSQRWRSSIQSAQTRLGADCGSDHELLPQGSMQRNRESNRMGNTRDFFKKSRDTEGTLHAKVSTMDRNGANLTEAEDAKKRWQEYTEGLYKKNLHDPDNHNGLITQLEPDILECEVKWALGSITTNKLNEGDGIPIELFQILKDDAVKVLHSIRQQIWKTQQWPQDWKRSVFIPIPKKGTAKECSNYCTIALISHTSKVK